MDSVLAQLEGLLEKVLKEEELTDCFLINMKKKDSKVVIYIDADEGVTFGKCKTISRKLEAYLDENLLLGEQYRLDVSSPGANSALKYLRQYHKHINRKIEVHLKDETTIEGVLKSIDDQILTVEVSTGKGKKKVVEQKTIEFLDINESFILLAF